MYQKYLIRFLNLIILGHLIFFLSACAEDMSSGEQHVPTYYANGSYDDNGVEPPPNNGNQNFGRRW